MGLLSDEDIAEIADRAGEEEQKPGLAIADRPAKEVNHRSTDEAVAQQMGQVGMEGKGGEQPPPFALMKNGAAVYCSLGKPDGTDRPGACLEIQEGQCDDGGKGRLAVRRPRLGRRRRGWPIAIFPPVVIELGAGGLGVLGSHQELTALPIEPVGDADRLEDQGEVLQMNERARSDGDAIGSVGSFLVRHAGRRGRDVSDCAEGERVSAGAIVTRLS